MTNRLGDAVSVVVAGAGGYTIEMPPPRASSGERMANRLGDVVGDAVSVVVAGAGGYTIETRRPIRRQVNA